MRKDFTLPELQAKLDVLEEGQLFAMSDADCERLFGYNDVAAARLRNFAYGHNCIVSQTEEGIFFRKRQTLV